MSIVTDSTPLEEPKNPDNNITKLYSLFATPGEIQAMKDNFTNGNYGYGHGKTELYNKILEYFTPYRKKRAELENNMDYVEKILKKGAEKARDIASKKVSEVRRTVGLIGRNY